MKVRFAPSLLAADFSRLGEQAREAAEAGANLLHFDVMDGHFVPNITFGPLVIRGLKGKISLPFHTHLMISDPEKYIDDFADAGCDQLFVHPETCTHLHRVLQQIRDAGVQPGVALNPATPLEALDYVLQDIDGILLMTVNPGFGGQEFIPAMLPKIVRTRELIRMSGRDIELGVDGGINEHTVQAVVEAGADTIIAGSSVFGGPGTVRENLGRLVDCVAAVAGG